MADSLAFQTIFKKNAIFIGIRIALFFPMLFKLIHALATASAANWRD